jgi:1-acyl-sn-glycerol-3-phosphate acyltransferase
MVRALWGVFADIAIVLYTLVIGSLVILASYVRPTVIERLATLWCDLVLWTSGARVDVIGGEQVPVDRSCILVANHQSDLDICALVHVLRTLPRFVTKKELMRIPVFGRAVRAARQIVIDRADPESAKHAIEEATRGLPGGVRLCFFAEGTRSKDGRIGRFKKGAAEIGLETGLPLVPVSISGTRKFMPKGAIILRPGGRIRIAFGPPVPTHGRSIEDREALTARLRDFVVREFDPTL